MKTTGNSDIGKKRSRNEDRFCFGECAENVYYAIVCDGMGGASGGQIASRMTCETVEDKIKKCYNKSMTERSIENLLLSAITTANVTVYDRAVSDSDLKGMGTTIVAAVSKDNNVCIAHVGDSRAYYITENKITQITKDHSLVEEMVRMGEITEEEARVHPDRHVITRAVGVTEDAEPDFFDFLLEPGAMILMCSDGLSNMIEDEDIRKILSKGGSLKKLTETLIGKANENGGKDNIAVILTKPDADEV